MVGLVLGLFCFHLLKKTLFFLLVFFLPPVGFKGSRSLLEIVADIFSGVLTKWKFLFCFETYGCIVVLSLKMSRSMFCCMILASPSSPPCL